MPRGGAGVYAALASASPFHVRFPFLSLSFGVYVRVTAGEQYRMHEEHRRCVRCNSGGGDGAPRPVRRPADLDTDIERVRERGRDPRRREREGGEVQLARAHTCRNTGAIHGRDARDARDDEDVVSRPSSSRCPSLLPPPPIFRRREREREKERVTHVTRLRRSCRGIPGSETGFSDVRARATHVAPVPRTAGSAGDGRGWLGRR